VETTKEDAKETIIHQTMLSNELHSKTSFACNPLQYKQKRLKTPLRFLSRNHP